MVTVYNNRYQTIITYWDGMGITVLRVEIFSAKTGHDGGLHPIKPWSNGVL